jgi:hypothetical protein
MCRCIDSKCVFAIHQLRPGIDAKLQRSGEIAGRSLTLITCYPFYFVAFHPSAISFVSTTLLTLVASRDHAHR